MSESFLQATYRAIRTALIAGSPVYGTRVYLRLAPASAAKPYAVVSFVGGGEQNAIKAVDPEIVLQIETVATTYDDALQGEADIADRLNDKGTQDDGGLPIDSGMHWEILSVTRGMIVDLIEMVDNVTPLYHVGAQYRFAIGEK